MTDPANQPDFGIQVQSEKSWLSQNWPWVLPIVFIIPLLCCCGCGGLGVWWMVNYVMDREPYARSIELVEDNESIQDALGTPMEVPGFWATHRQGGTIDYNAEGGTETFAMEVPVRGPSGEGLLVVEAERDEGEDDWTYLKREFRLGGSTQVIQLRDEEEE